jgi:predicted GNAT superfamily acetyltransferase
MVARDRKARHQSAVWRWFREFYRGAKLAVLRLAA